MNDPRATHLFDQVAAAAREGETFIQQFAVAHRGVKQSTPPVGIVADIENTMYRRLVDQTTTRCPHIKDSVTPMWWMPYRPERLNCMACYDQVQMEIAGTIEDRTCDDCGREVLNDMHASCAQIPAIFIPEIDLAIGPILVLFGLCTPCYDRQKEAEGA